MLQVNSQARFSIADECYLRAGLSRYLKVSRNDGNPSVATQHLPLKKGEKQGRKNSFFKNRVTFGFREKSNNDSVAHRSSCSLKNQEKASFDYLYWLEDSQYNYAMSQPSLDEGLHDFIRHGFYSFKEKRTVSVYKLLLTEIEEAACYCLSVLTLFNVKKGAKLSGLHESTYLMRLRKYGVRHWQHKMLKQFNGFEYNLQETGILLPELPSDLQARQRQYLLFNLLHFTQSRYRALYRVAFCEIVQRLVVYEKTRLSVGEGSLSILKDLLMQAKRCIWCEAGCWVGGNNEKHQPLSHSQQLKQLLGVTECCYRREYVNREYSSFI